MYTSAPVIDPINFTVMRTHLKQPTWEVWIRRPRLMGPKSISTGWNCQCFSSGSGESPRKCGYSSTSSKNLIQSVSGFSRERSIFWAQSSKSLHMAECALSAITRVGCSLSCYEFGIGNSNSETPSSEERFISAPALAVASCMLFAASTSISILVRSRSDGSNIPKPRSVLSSVTTT